jgi:hypothetical protein
VFVQIVSVGLICREATRGCRKEGERAADSSLPRDRISDRIIRPDTPDNPAPDVGHRRQAARGSVGGADI